MLKQVLILSLLLAPALSHAGTSDSNPCEAVADKYAKEQLHELYTPSQIRRDEIVYQDANLDEMKANGFQTWTVEYGAQEECLDGFSMLLRASADGNSCAFIKTFNESGNRDCG